MKSILYTLSLIFLVSCSNNDEIKSNPYIPNFSFNTGSLIDTNLPQFSQLKFANNYITLYDSYGINGVVLYYFGSNQYSAFELSDPNHFLTTCSNLIVEGVIATCSCDDGNSYEILGGLGVEGTTGTYTLTPYRVDVFGNIIQVSND